MKLEFGNDFITHIVPFILRYICLIENLQELFSTVKRIKLMGSTPKIVTNTKQEAHGPKHSPEKPV